MGQQAGMAEPDLTAGSRLNAVGSLERRCWIVVPACGLASLTRRCLDAIAADPPAVDFGVLIVDDGSTTPAPEALAAHSTRARFLIRGTNGGFATACNDGAAETAGEFLVFLNNDTVPQPGWLDALVRHADEHPAAAVVGTRLLFPDDTVQHAGVVFCRDGMPRHVYAGFDRDHPAVVRSRRFHAVTAACMLVRREAFEAAGGFDPAFHNGLEDVDLCLRIEEHGHEVRYCADAVVYHLESASRGRDSRAMTANVRLFRERWRGRVRPDELDVYADDGLLSVGYESTYPLHVTVAPELATVGERTRELDRLASRLARHLADLLLEVTRLTVRCADSAFDPAVPIARAGNGREGLPQTGDTFPAVSLETILRRAEDIEAQIHGLQTGIAGLAGNRSGPFELSPVLAYRQLVRELRRATEATTPEGASVLVVSNGDEELVRLDGRVGRHFPQDHTGTYLGYHPADSEAAIRHLEALRSNGAEYLVFPSTAEWWLSHYDAFARHLDRTCSVVSSGGTGRIYALAGAGGEEA